MLRRGHVDRDEDGSGRRGIADPRPRGSHPTRRFRKHRLGWIADRELPRAPDSASVWPVRIAAGAFGEAQPSRDLLLSPDHAVFVDDVLIPVKHLINGYSITQVPVDRVTYYHIELPGHDVLLAEGLPVESYLDTGDRSNFANGGGAISLHPEFMAGMWEAKGCAKLVVTGPVLEMVRARVAMIASDLVPSDAKVAIFG